MQKVLDFLQGKKTYIMAIGIGIIATLNALGITIPEYVYAILTALGLTFSRNATSNITPPK